MSGNTATEITLHNNSERTSCDHQFASEMLYYIVRQT